MVRVTPGRFSTGMNVNRLVKHVQRRTLPPPEERRRIREEAGITQAELGAALGVTGAAIGRWEKGDRHPGRRRAPSYAEALRRIENGGDW